MHRETFVVINTFTAALAIILDTLCVILPFWLFESKIHGQLFIGAFGMTQCLHGVCEYHPFIIVTYHLLAAMYVGSSIIRAFVCYHTRDMTCIALMINVILKGVVVYRNMYGEHLYKGFWCLTASFALDSCVLFGLKLEQRIARRQLNMRYAE